jgi:hypothetical protein
MKKNPKTVAFVKEAFDPLYGTGGMQTTISITQDLDEDHSNQIILKGDHSGLHGIHIFRKTSEKSNGGHKLWELTDG